MGSEVWVEVVTDQVPFGEGPVWCEDGTVVCTSVSHGLLHRVRVDDGTVTVVADTAGGPNAAAPAAGGGFVVTQNGGYELSGQMSVPQPPVRWTRGGLQHVAADGTVEYLTPEPLQKPNDLVIAADGTIYFTDPPFHGAPGNLARISALHPDGTVEVLADGFAYVNGIALDPDGTSLVVVADDDRLLRLRDLGRGPREDAVRDLREGGGDGFCLDVEGRYYVAARRAGGVRVFDADGTEVDFLALPPGDGTPDDPGGMVTNCCFGGPDMRWLFAMDARRGRMVVWHDLPTPGLALVPWPGRGDRS